MTTRISPKLEAGWKEALAASFSDPRMIALKDFLRSEKASGQTVYPPASRMFAAFDSTPWDKVRVVILGQDPYHGPGQANGLCFSVNPGVPIPPSLLNIYKEIENDLGIPRPSHGDLTSWAEQGVLLLNATLSVRAHQAGSHQKKGWEEFTDDVVARLNEEKSGLVFMLWGSYARKKGAIIDRSRHTVLQAPHPSPLSAHRGFFGCGHFSKVNEVLQAQGRPPIDWGV